MREHHSKNWDRGLQNGREARRNVQFTPKEEGIIPAKHEQPGEGKNCIIASAPGPELRPPNRNQDEDCDGDYEADCNERHRWQIAKSDFDDKPGRAPNHAEREPCECDAPVSPHAARPSFSESDA